MAEPSAKILRRTLDETLDGEADNIDRLSALPESVLLSILSRLELKEAAATSVLSTTWRDFFLQLPNIHLTFDIDGNPSDLPRLFHIFIPFANRVLRERNPEAPVKSLKVSVMNFTERMEQEYRSLLISAAAAVSTYKVYQFDLHLTSSELDESLRIVLPNAMFISETITKLHLTLSAGWDVPQNVWLPNVMTAHFIPYTLMHEDSTQRFLDGCPRLRSLILMIGMITKYETKVKTLRMSSSSLKSLKIGWDQTDETYESDMIIIVKSESLQRLTLSLTGGHKVNVDAPKLNFFSITGDVTELNMIQSFPLIYEVFLDAQYTTESPIYSQNASTFLKALENVLSDPTTVMPTFINMYKINLIPDFCHRFPRSKLQQVLLKLFENCPNLQELCFHEVNVFYENYLFQPVDFESAFPMSMVQNLKQLEVFDFKGREIEYKVVEFFMKNGRCLDTVSLRKDSTFAWRPNQEERILSFVTCSENCKIIFRERSEYKSLYKR